MLKIWKNINYYFKINNRLEIEKYLKQALKVSICMKHSSHVGLCETHH